jgi:hypothetical protein
MKSVFIILVTPALVEELRELFGDILNQFPGGHSYLLASRVEISHPFVLVTLKNSSKSGLRSVWIQSQCVLSVVEGDTSVQEAMGFRP